MTLAEVSAVDSEALRRYFGSLSRASRFNRFLSPVSAPSLVEMSTKVQPRIDRFALLLGPSADGALTVIAELDYEHDDASNSIEFGVSVSDAWQGHGVGESLVRWLEERAGKLGAISLYGDTFKSNHAALGLARKLGFLTVRHQWDWQLVRCEKEIKRRSR